MSALKTISGFSNSYGGELFIGISDDAVFQGLRLDYEVLGVDDFDGWELRFRQLIEARVSNGRSLLSYIEVDPIRNEIGTIARILVAPCPRLVLVNKERRGRKNWTLYVRQGNRTVSLGWTDLEDFFDLSKRF